MKKVITLAVLSSIFTFTTAQAAGNGTINFTGAVNNQTCSATINGATGASAAAVNLPTVQADTLSTPGNTAGQTAFIMGVTGCAATSPSGAGTVKAYFEKGANVDSNGRLINTTASTSGGATGLVLELVDGTGGTALKAGDISQNTGNFVTIADGSATLPYSIRYYATDAAEAGVVTSSVTYSLIYN